MTQEERRLYLIRELLKERNEEFDIPQDETEQRNLLRALMNVRDALAISREFLTVQNAYLQQVNRERGITDLAEIDAVEGRPHLYLWQGDITTLKVDAIVNAANSQLLGCFSPLHACIDNCIHSYAGIQLRLACNDLMQKQGHEEETGLCKITPAFNLPSRFVLHTVGPIVRGLPGPRDKLLLASCYKSCLEKASEKHLESIAFCCISTGVFHFPAEKAAEVAVRTVESWLLAHPRTSIQKVVFNVFGDRDLAIYRRILS